MFQKRDIMFIMIILAILGIVSFFALASIIAVAKAPTGWNYIQFPTVLKDGKSHFSLATVKSNNWTEFMKAEIMFMDWSSFELRTNKFLFCVRGFRSCFAAADAQHWNDLHGRIVQMPFKLGGYRPALMVEWYWYSHNGWLTKHHAVPSMSAETRAALDAEFERLLSETEE